MANKSVEFFLSLRFFASIFLFLAIQGCSTMEPFKPINKDASLDERKEIFEKYSVNRRPFIFESFELALESKASQPNPRMNVFQLEGYYEKSGDEISAEMMKKWRYYHVAGSIAYFAGLGMLASGIYFEKSDGAETKTNIGIGLIAAGFGAQTYGWFKYVYPAAASFNKYLSDQLRISVIQKKAEVELQASLDF